MAIGDIHNRLTILEEGLYLGQHKAFKVRCKCGTEKLVRASRVLDGYTKSCGCLAREVPTNLTHGMTDTRIYLTWVRMHQRCYNQNSPMYFNYGGRGIKVEEPWHDFAVFYKDMGDIPDGMSLEREDTNGNYCKSNCKWATATEQNNNRRNSVRYMLNGELKTVKELAALAGVSYRTMHLRLHTYKIPVERAVSSGKKIRGSKEASPNLIKLYEE